MRAIFVASRYVLTNLFLLIAIGAALSRGLHWISTTCLFALLVGGLIAEVVGDDPSRVGPYGRMFYEINLFATLPLLTVLGYLLVRAATPRDIGIALAAGYFFALAGATVAHELIHRTTSNVSLHCARALFAFSLNPTFGIYHVQGHHRNVGIYGDPSTALRGESIYAFRVRTILTQSTEAWRYEAGRLQRRGTRIFSIENRILIGAAGFWRFPL
jgi:hypothetical protein